MRSSEELDLAPERRALLTRIQFTFESKGSRLLVAGEPGSGKSYLLNRALATVPPTVNVLFTLCVQTGQQPLQALRDLLSPTTEEMLRGLPADMAAALRDFLQDSAAPPMALSKLQAAVTSILSEHGRAGSVVVIDDLHWIDPESLQLLQRAFVRRAVSDGLSVVATRQVEGRGEDLAIRPIIPLSAVTPIPPLTPPTLHGLVRSALGPQLTEAQLDDVVRRSAGNPLWALELGGAVLRGEDLAASLPIRIRTIMGKRLSELAPELQQLVRVVAAIGKARIADVATAFPGAGESIEVARKAGLLRDDGGRLVVSHPLLAAAALNLLSPAEQRRLHSQIASLPLNDGERALHRDLAQPPGADERIARSLHGASRAARRAGGAQSSLVLARRAVARTPSDSPLLAERVLDMADSAMAATDAVSALEALDSLDFESLGLVDFDRGAQLLGDALLRTAGDGAVRMRFQRLAWSLPEDDSRALIARVWSLKYGRIADSDLTERLASAENELKRRHVAPFARAAALATLITARLDQGYGVDFTRIDEIRVLERDVVIRSLEGTADAMHAALPYQADDLETSRGRLVEYQAAAKAAGEDYELAQAAAHLSIIDVLVGNVGAAARRLRSIADSEALLTRWPPSLFRAKGLILLAEGQTAALHEMVDRPLNPAAEHRGELLKIGLSGLLAAREERWATACALLAAARDIAASRGINEPGRRLWLDIELGRSYVALGHVDEAERIVTSLDAISAEPGRIHARGQARRLRALIANRRGGSSRELFDAATSDIERGGFRPELVRTLLDGAASMARDGDQSAAHDYIRAATRFADDVDDPVLSRVVARAQTDTESMSRIASLSRAERRVAVLAADGAMNREIASQLYLSVRTVESHLASVYRKLGVRSRTELAVVMQRVER